MWILDNPILRGPPKAEGPLMELTIQNHVQTEPEASICVGIIETQSGISCLCRELRKCPAWIWGQKIRPMRPRLPQTFLIVCSI